MLNQLDVFGLAQGTGVVSHPAARLTARVFVDFWRRLLQDVGRSGMLIVDSDGGRRFKDVACHVESTEGQLRLFFVSAYSPRVSLDEWVWRNVKGPRLRRSRFTVSDNLRRRALPTLHRLQRRFALVRRCLQDPDLR